MAAGTSSRRTGGDAIVVMTAGGAQEGDWGRVEGEDKKQIKN
jgi:hypothetical protein